MTGLLLRPIEPADAPAWDAFVQGHPDGTFFHLSAWCGVIERAFGHPTHYTVAERDGSVCGVLPLAHVRSMLFGNALVSVPFGVYGGPLAEDGETASALADHAEQLMRRTGAKAVEFRHRDPADGDWIERPELYVTFRKAISADDEQNLKAIPRKQRAMVRKGIGNGLVSAVDQDTGLLHRIYAESVRNLGTPVFSRGYFRLLAEVFRDCCDVLTVRDQGRPIAAVL
ncbi:MAG: FemAB family XrtA/PEP-CTERM system-associated protein, partial [Acetobacteraceae bacterium]